MIALTSDSVKPNLSSDESEKISFTFMLFRPENIPDLATFITPITYAI